MKFQFCLVSMEVSGKMDIEIKSTAAFFNEKRKLTIKSKIDCKLNLFNKKKTIHLVNQSKNSTIQHF